MMMHGGDGDGGGVKMKIGGQQFVNGGKDGDCVFCRGFGGAGRIRLDGRDQRDTQASRGESRRFEFAIDAQMVFAEGSGPGNGNTHRGLAHSGAVHPCGALTGCSGALPDFPDSPPSTAFRQRP